MMALGDCDDPSVRDLARRLAGVRNEEEDLLQDALLLALSTQDDVKKPQQWMRTVMRRVWWRHVRRERERSPRERLHARHEAITATDEVVARTQLEQLVRQAVLELPDPYRRTIIMRFFEDLPVREIARREAIPSETVRTRIKRGYARLRGLLVPASGTTDS